MKKRGSPYSGAILNRLGHDPSHIITTLFRFSIFMLIKWLHGVVIIATKGEVKSCRITASLDHSPGQALLLLHSALGLKYKYRCRRQIQIQIQIGMKIQID